MAAKHVLVGVTGGIAAYKACDLVSSLSKLSYKIKVVMTENATQFVHPLTFEALCHNKVETSLFNSENDDPIAHINLAKWADLMIIVPASADVIAKIVHGISDDLLTTTFLACECIKMLCPAMNVHMFENPVTQENLTKARQLGYHILDPVSGLLACRDIGKGKLPPVPEIVRAIEHTFKKKQRLKGKRILISAGPTQEAIDPVRYISNHSSGKQGYAIARAALDMGADVTVVAGPVALADIEGAKTIHIHSAQEMFETVQNEYKSADYIIMAAAVADYRPVATAEQKIKKSGDELLVKFVRNPDILAYLGRHKTHQLICGFAMETQNLDENARAKLQKKNCDLLIGNNLFTVGAGFQGDTNVVSVVTKRDIQHWPKSTKTELGYKILETMIELEKDTVSC